MKKFCAILFSFVLVLIIALPVAAEGESSTLADNAPSLTAPAAYVVNLDTNIVVYEKNSETPLSAASLTKLMTTLLLLENYQDQLDSISLTAPSYVYDLIWEQSTNASSADIRRGETQSLRNLLYAMLLPSGNEAAYIVADYMGGGSIDNFVAMMNDEAVLKHTVPLRKGQILYQAQMKVCCDAPFFLCVNVPRHGREAPEYEKVL